MITKVQSYQTSDGKLHTDKVEALNHDLKIQLRGFVQTNTVGAGNLSTTEVAALLANQMDGVCGIFANYRKRIAAITRKTNKTLDVSAKIV